jgi:MFS family permease
MSKTDGEGRNSTSPFKRTFSSFKNPVFRLYYGGMIGQMAAFNMQGITNSLLIYRLTGSSVILGAMSLANAIPMLIFSLYGGVIADRVQKKWVVLYGQAAFAVVSFSVAIALIMGYLSPDRAGSWWVLVVSSALQGGIMGLMAPSRVALIREIVSGEQLMNAVSLNTMGMNICGILGPAVAGFLIDAIGFKAVYFAMTAMFLMSVAFIWFLPRTSPVNTQTSSALAGISEGFKYIFRERTMLILLLFTLFMVILSMPYGMMMPIFADDILKVGASGMGILLSVSGIGAITGSLALASLPNQKRGMLLLVSGVLLGLALTGFAMSNSWPLSLVMIAFVGVGQSGRMTLSNTLVQYYVDDVYRGRVMSIMMMEFGISSFGTFATGVLAESMGVQLAVGGFAAVLFVISVLGLFFLPRIRKLN